MYVAVKNNAPQIRWELRLFEFRTYAIAAGSPATRLQTLRRAFMDTMKNAEFLAGAEKSKVLIDPMAGDEVEKTVNRFLRLEPAMATKLKEIFSAQ